MNIVVLKGNLTRDPEKRNINAGGRSTAVTNFSIAVNRHFKRNDGTKDKEVTYVDCEAWDTGAETIAKYLKKGDPLLIHGALKLDTWETNGQKRSRLKIRVNSFEFLGGSKKSEDSSAEEETPVAAEDYTSDPDPASDGGDIPF